MAMHVATCDLANQVINPDQTISCTAWQMREVTFPMYELSPEDLTSVLGATLGFLIICYGGRQILKSIYAAAHSD